LYLNQDLTVCDHDFIENLIPILIEKKNELTRTQDLVKSYHDAGQFYWGSISNWLSKKKIHSNGIGMQIPIWRSVDIDNLEDWKKAELLFKILNRKN